MNRPPQSAVLVTIDCLRADHVGHFGYSRPTTPFLDWLAQKSLVFRNATAAGTPTYYSLPAVMASRYPLALGRDLIGLAPDESTLASVLQESGYATAAFSAGNPYIGAQFGYDRGFDVFLDFLRAGIEEPAPQSDSGFRGRANRLISRASHAIPALGAVYDELYFQYCQSQVAAGESLDTLRKFPDAEVIVQNACGWLQENSTRPFFLWLHLMDPHAPYFPKAEALTLMGDHLTPKEALYLNSYWARTDLTEKRLAGKRDRVIALYDAGIRWADEQIRRLAEKLVELNLWDRCAFAITADHGEEFLDHGGRFHPPLKLTEELIHVPLLLRVPGESHAEIEQTMSLIDLAPTLLEVLDIPAPGDFRGRSRWGKIFQPEWHPAITEAVHGCTNPFRPENRLGSRVLCLRKGCYKLVFDFASGEERLFDLSSDAIERSPLPAGTAMPVRRELLECARRHVAESYKSRDFDRRTSVSLRDLRLEWAQPAPGAPN
jgi:arylsulfatase A-like enzyme